VPEEELEERFNIKIKENNYPDSQKNEIYDMINRAMKKKYSDGLKGGTE
jgi:hypothetical protein